jgi:hypothetical protein
MTGKDKLETNAARARRYSYLQASGDGLVSGDRGKRHHENPILGFELASRTVHRAGRMRRERQQQQRLVGSGQRALGLGRSEQWWRERHVRAVRVGQRKRLRQRERRWDELGLLGLLGLLGFVQ